MNLEINILAPGRCGSIFKSIIFKCLLQSSSLDTRCEIAFGWMPQNITVDWSKLIEVMVWCRQTTNHCLNRCWPRFLSPYGITRPQRVNILDWFLRYFEHFPDSMGPTWGPPGSCRPQMGPMLAPWTLLSVNILLNHPPETTTLYSSLSTNALHWLGYFYRARGWDFAIDWRCTVFGTVDWTLASNKLGHFLEIKL